MSFPTTPILSTFDGADEDPLSEGGLWNGPIRTVSNLRIQLVANALKRTTAGQGQAYLDVDLGGDDSEVYCQLTAALVGAGSIVGLVVRLHNPNHATLMEGYFGSFNLGTGWRIFRGTGGGTFAQLGSTVASPTPAPGDWLGLSIKNTTLRLKHLVAADGIWYDRVVVDDTVIAATGSSYIGLELSGTSHTVDNVGGGLIVTPPSARQDFARSDVFPFAPAEEFIWIGRGRPGRLGASSMMRGTGPHPAGGFERQLHDRLHPEYAAAAGPTYDDAPDGGIQLDGTTEISTDRAASPSGGLVLGGTTTTSTSRDTAPTGGLRLAGTATAAAVRDTSPAGGLVLGGSASSSAQRQYDQAPAGGLVLGGTTTVSRSFATTPAGGLVLGGTPGTTITWSTAPAGGLVLAGTTTTTRSFATTPAGGLILGGTASSTAQRQYDQTPAGGLILGGATTTTRSFATTPTGGLVLGGTTTTTTSRDVAPAGGLILGGTATTTRAIAATPAGGLVLGGSSSSTLDTAGDSFPSGGIRLAGTTTTTLVADRSVAGGLRLAGAASSTRDLSAGPSDGIRLAGSSSTTLIATATPAGGLLLAGAAIVGQGIGIATLTTRAAASAEPGRRQKVTATLRTSATARRVTLTTRR